MDGVFYFTFIKKRMQPTNFFRYTFTNRNGTKVVAPLGESDYKLEWSREDETKFFYKKEFPSKVVLAGDDFNYLLQLEKSVYRCEFTSVEMERFCETWVPWFTARISLNAGTWDLDRCTVEIKFDEINPDQCLTDAKNDKVNLFSLVDINLTRTIKIYPGSLSIEKVEYQTSYGPGNCSFSPYWAGTGTPEAGGWKDYYNEFVKLVNYLGDPVSCRKYTKWARYVTTLPASDQPPGPEWILLSNTGGFKKYAKPVILGQCTETIIGTVGTKNECEIISPVAEIDNGLHLNEILPGIVSHFCPGVTVVSDFFQINPETVSTINYVTGIKSRVNNLVFFQKSDVKRPAVSGNATKAEITPDQLLNALIFMFNVRWRLEGNVFRIEHISFFQRNSGLDLTAAKFAKFINRTRVYSYDTPNIPQREEFKFMEADGRDFVGLPIVYNSACVTKESRENIKTFAVDNITTDLEFVLSNPNSDSKNVSDQGFVIIAAEVVGTDLRILSDPPILDTRTKLNNPLSWAHLQYNFHRHYRPLRVGVMNNNETEFFSSQPTKKGKTLTVPLCCGDEFHPEDTIFTNLGMGVVQKAVFNFKDQTLALDLLYETGVNTAPVATLTPIFYKSGDRTTRVLRPRFKDAQGNPTVTSLHIVSGPGLGTATVSGVQIIYTPGNSITAPAQDIIVFNVTDENGATSNNALISITFAV